MQGRLYLATGPAHHLVYQQIEGTRSTRGNRSTHKFMVLTLATLGPLRAYIDVRNGEVRITEKCRKPFPPSSTGSVWQPLVSGSSLWKPQPRQQPRLPLHRCAMLRSFRRVWSCSGYTFIPVLSFICLAGEHEAATAETLRGGGRWRLQRL